MKGALLVIGMCIALVGCGEKTKPRIMEYDLAPIAKDKVLSVLKDPDSAKFSYTMNVIKHQPVKGKDAYAVCGEVNAKNAFGGYTGSKRFFVMMYVENGTDLYSNDPVIESIQIKEFDTMHSLTCEKH